MCSCFKKLIFSAFLLAGGSLNAATVDLNGKAYQVLSGGYDIGVPISTKLGESTTISYAYKVSGTLDEELNTALANGRRSFREQWPLLESYYPKDSSNTAFSFKIHDPLGFNDPLYQGPSYLLFDLTFAPTASTIMADDEVLSSDPNAPRVFTTQLFTEFGFTNYAIVGPNDAATRLLLDGYIQNGLYNDYDIFTRGNSILAFEYTNDTLGPTFNILGTVLPETTSVAPVPIPGSLAMLGMGLLGLGALMQRKT